MRWLAACLALMLIGGAVALVTHPRGDVPTIRLAVWGAEEEMAEFRARVADPVAAQIRPVRLQVMVVPRDYYVKLSTLMAAGQAPDLFWLDQEHIPMYAYNGALLDLKRRVEVDDDAVVRLEDYYPQILSSYQHDGQLVGLPWIAQPVLLYVNTRLFGEAKVGLPSVAWWWADLLDAARRLTRDLDGDGVPDRWGLALDVNWPPLAMFVWQNDGSLLSTESGELRLSTQATLGAAQFWHDLIYRHRVAPPLYVVRQQGLAGLFRQERVAMYFGGAADSEDRAADPRYPMDPSRRLPVQVFEVPAGPGGTRATFAWHAGLHISSQTVDADLAYRVFKLLLARIHRWKIPAPRRSLAQAIEEVEPRKAQAAEAIRRSMGYMRVLRPIPRLAEWQTRYTESFLEPIIMDRLGPEEAARRTEPRLKEVMPP